MTRNGVGALLVGLLLLPGCFSGDDRPDSPTTTGPPPPGSYELAKLVDGLSRPVYLTHAGDGSGRLFVVEQAGKVRVWTPAGLAATPFLDIDPLVGSSGNEQGLLSIAFHPQYEDNGRAFVYYTNNDGDITIAAYKVSSTDPGRLDSARAEVLLTIDHSTFNNHNGGLLKFGPDGYLYAGIGDGGAGGDPTDNAQNTLVLLGKLLRIDVDVASGYGIPPDNPFRDQVAGKEIWAYGLRNPWRYSFDRSTGDLYIADVGQDRWEEVNFQARSSRGGENYGWDWYEGEERYKQGVPLGTFVEPVAVHSLTDEENNCAVIGGYVYRGAAIPFLQGRYLHGDYCSGLLWSLEKAGDAWSLVELQATGQSISSFGEDESGELYVIDHDGVVYKFVPA